MLKNRTAVAVSLVTALIGLSAPAAAQKQGGTLTMYHRDSPASASIHRGLKKGIA